MEDLKKSFIIKGDHIIGAVGDKNFSTLPIGCIAPYLGRTDNIPRGYLFADGSSYKTTDYPELFNIIRYTYGGSGDTFNVPNLSDGRFLEGSIISGGYVNAGLPNIEGKWIGDYKHAPYLEGTFEGAFSKGEGTGIKTYGTNDGGGDNVFIFDASKSNPIYGNADTVQPKSLMVLYIIKAFHTNEGVDSTNEVSDPIIEYVDNKVDGLISDTTTNTNSTWSSSMIASQINNATAIKRSDVIAANTIKETGWNLAQGESHFYGRLLQLDGHLGSKSSTFSFLLFVKANYDNPTTVYVTQLAGMDDDRSNIGHTTYFELGVSSSGNLTIKNKSAVAASYRFI